MKERSMSDKNSTLTQEMVREALSYNPSTGEFKWAVTRGAIKAGYPAGSKHNRGYLTIRLFGKLYLLHRVAWLYEHGAWPEEQIDHINGDKKDNRIANLRCVSGAINAQNKSAAIGSNKSSGLLGVSYNKKLGRWHAYINVNRRRKFLGYHDTAETAHAAYIKAKREIHPGCTI
jgi:hypothetical protein